MFIKQDPVKHMLAVAAVVVFPDLVDLVELAVAVMVEQQVIMAVMPSGTTGGGGRWRCYFQC